MVCAELNGGFVSSSLCMAKVSHQDDLTLSDKEFQIAHGKSSFMKPERVAKISRENAGLGQLRFLSCVLGNL